MQTHLILLTLGIGLAASACAGRAPVSAPVEPGPIRLRAGDAIRLELKDEPELTAEYPVSPEGTVMFPMVGVVAVADRSFDEVTARVRDDYGRELRDPVLILVPLMRVTVAGEARAAGVFMVDPTFTLADVLAQAGGLSPSAATGRAVLIRDGHAHELRYDTGSTVPAIAVRSGDRLIVPRRNWIRENMPALIGSATAVVVSALTALLVR